MNVLVFALLSSFPFINFRLEKLKDNIFKSELETDYTRMDTASYLIRLELLGTIALLTSRVLLYFQYIKEMHYLSVKLLGLTNISD